MESDCTQVVVTALEKAGDRSPSLNTISDIKFLAGQDRVSNFVKVDRSKVRVSHCLTNFARVEQRTVIWLRSAPPYVVFQEVESELFVAPTSS
jgi:hypothetical protein